MLTTLHIQNYAIIEELSVHFTAGLNVITGETGAGKSILMGALNLILGQRADSTVLQNREKKCMVEGHFQIEKTAIINEFFENNDLDFEDELVIRREILSNGKSRSFINDTPVNLSQVKELGIQLADLHQQFDTLEINSENFQREIIDALAENNKDLLLLKKEFNTYSTIKKDLGRFRDQQMNEKKELEYHQFLTTELEEAAWKENELEQIEAELKLSTNAESIKQQLTLVYEALDQSEEPIVQRIKSLYHKLAAFEHYHEGIKSISERLLSTSIELQDIADELDRVGLEIDFDPERNHTLNERLSVGYKLMKKHGVQSTQELLEIFDGLQKKLLQFADLTSTIEALEKQEKSVYQVCLKIAQTISSKRKAVVDSFVQDVNALLVRVGMPNARLKVEIVPSELTSVGIDKVHFLFDANNHNVFEHVGKVASGGELSRLMLSIKSLAAKKVSLPTLIFDEIDTGISGEAAKQVGGIMKELSGHHQLLTITHQPQIAAKATTHFFVYKETIHQKIATGIKVLASEDRVMAIASMLSGEKPTKSAIENAREMIG